MNYLKSTQELKDFMNSCNDGDTFYYCDQKYLVFGKKAWEYKNIIPFSSRPGNSDVEYLKITLIIKEVKTNIAVCGILQYANRIVSVKRKDSELFGLIGGKVDENETLEEALIRETKEETGFNVSIDYSTYPYIAEENDGYLVLCYKLKLNNTGHTKIKEDEKPFLYLLTPEQLKTYSPFQEYNEKAFKWFSI